MPVHKYRSVDEMPRPTRCREAELEARMRAVWTRAFLLSPPSFPRGVRFFRNMEEANEARFRDTERRMRAQRPHGEEKGISGG